MQVEERIYAYSFVEIGGARALRGLQAIVCHAATAEPEARTEVERLVVGSHGFGLGFRSFRRVEPEHVDRWKAWRGWS